MSVCPYVRMSVCPFVRMSLYNDDCESSLNPLCDLDIHVEFLETCAELTVSEFDAIFDKIPDMFCEEIQESLDSEMSELCFVLFFLRLLVIKRNGPPFSAHVGPWNILLSTSPLSTSPLSAIVSKDF